MINEAPGRGRMRQRRRALRRPGQAASDRRTVPFDHAFRFDLTGVPDTSHVGTIEVSVEATYHAVSIGYGVVPDVTPITFGPAPADLVTGSGPILTVAEGPPPSLANLSFGKILGLLAGGLGESNNKRFSGVGPLTARALRSGFRLNPQFADAVFVGSAQAINPSVLAQVFQVVPPPAKEVRFTYALSDKASGREFQSEPILNLAGLGAADGNRPARYFARPIEFPPRSLIRIEIVEKSDFRGELHISLQGFKVLGGAGTPTGRSGA